MRQNATAGMKSNAGVCVKRSSTRERGVWALCLRGAGDSRAIMSKNEAQGQISVEDLSIAVWVTLSRWVSLAVAENGLLCDPGSSLGITPYSQLAL